MAPNFRLIGGVRYVNDTVTATLLQDDVVNLVPQFDGGGNLIPWTETNPIDFVSTLAVLQGAGVGTVFNFELEEFLPRVGVEYELNDDVLLYANAARGARNGGIGNAIAALGASGGNQDLFFDNLSFADDQVLSIDAGVKASWFGGDLITNVGVFRTTYEDTQIWVNTPANNTINGPDQTIFGMEVEAMLQVSESLSTFLNVAVVDAEFETGAVITAAPGGSVGPFDLQAGNQPANIPEFNLSTGYTYTRPLGSNGWMFTSTGSFQYIGERYSDVQNYPTARLDTLESVNLSVELSNDVWSVGLFGTNLLNDIEAVSIGSNPLQQFINADGELDAPVIGTSVNRPRTVGVRASFRY